MRAIERVFDRLNERGEGALIAYVAGGDPKLSYTPRIVGALINGGADIVELGIPFSDPITDGPTIQAATVRALRNGATPKIVLEAVQKIKREHDTPIVILTYYNPVFRMGLKAFFSLAESCGVDGIIVPDLPIEEASDFEKVAETHSIDTIFLASPSTPIQRLRKIIDHTSGFLYLVSLFGVTGARERLQDLTVQTIRRFLPYTRGRIPVAVGFGMSEPEHVKTVIENGVDGAIVGSAFVKIIEENQEDIDELVKRMETKTRQLKRGTLSKRALEKLKNIQR
ncbi:MAG: tryptophan synthase subunit alpha [Aigarchaeota archaeon]|nr:tryptophan synthase subunit alpha [Aigarchaeota archaeon]